MPSLKKYIPFFMIILFIAFGNISVTYAAELIRVDANTVVNDTSKRQLGINTNYLWDDDSNRNSPKTTAAALKEMGVKYLRYPGGEKSDANLWSVPPFTQSIPTLARTGTCEWPSADRNIMEPDMKTFKIDPLDFDEFISMARTVGAEPVIVVAYDSIYKISTCNGIVPTRQQLIDTATAWVRYANINKRYGVKYWEIGNESYLNSYNGFATASNYATDLKVFSQAMKSVDPTIKVGANGGSSSWWQTVLTASAYIDFLIVHEYPLWQWGDYEYYRTHNPNLTGEVNRAVNAINNYAATGDRDRLRIAITEANAFDWSTGGWESINDLGHSLVLFEMLGSYLLQNKVDFTLVWNTRWNNFNTTSMNDTLDINNNLKPSGKIIQIWQTFLQNKLVSTTGTAMIKVFAARDEAKSVMSVYLLNKDVTAKNIQFNYSGFPDVASAERWVFKGDSPQDLSPTYNKISNVSVSQNNISFTVDPLSVTVVQLKTGVVPENTATPTPTPYPVIQGDADGDGRVNITDYSVWLGNISQNLGGAVDGDFNGNGRVDGVDFIIWLKYFMG